MKIDHIAIAVRDLADSLETWTSLFQLPAGGFEDVPERGVRLVKLQTASGPALELIAPLGDDSTVRRFLEKRGEGIHHICFEVPELDETVRALRARGVRFLQSEPVPGAEGSRIIFMHPAEAGGVLIELKAARPES